MATVIAMGEKQAMEKVEEEQLQTIYQDEPNRHMPPRPPPPKKAKHNKRKENKKTHPTGKTCNITQLRISKTSNVYVQC